jgi:hypothetical protein
MKRQPVFISAFLLTVCLLTPEINVSAQQAQVPDKYTLLTMPFNLRQLTLYRGQIEAHGGYKFAVRSQMYNSDGEKVYLVNTGTGTVYHYYFADIKYGITDFLTAGVETNYIRRGVREESVVYSSNILTTSDRVSVNKLTEYKGLGDILFTASLRLPIKYRWFDFSATGGLYIPSSEYKPEQPKNSVTNITTASSYTVNYHYNYRNGYGVPVWLLSAAVKIRAGKFTALSDFSFRTPKNEGTNIRWDETMTDKVFSYKELNYTYLLSNSYQFNFAMHYQPTGWFDVNMNLNSYKSSGGWTESNGNRYKNPGKRLLSVEPGIELQVSPGIVIYQVAGFSVAGKNMDAPFYLFTTVRYSIIPFRRR